MLGDRYQVFVSIDGQTVPCGIFDDWKSAKTMRGNEFTFRKAQAAWVMRSNPSLELRQEKIGYTLRIDKYDR